MSGIEVRIINNLKARCHPVNDIVTLNGIKPVTDGYTALQKLIKEGTVEKTDYLYELSLSARFHNEVTLRRVK